jgi:hemerythrin-like domain-containing protein
LPESKASPVVRDLIRIHSIITRGLNVAIENSQSLVQRGYPDTSTRDGFVSYVRTFASVLDAHHLLEDELAFPYLRDKLPDVPYDLLMAQHREIVVILNEIKATVEEMKASAHLAESLNKLNHGLRTIGDIWHPHIRVEEDHFTAEKINALINMEEQERMSRKFSEHSQQHATPDYLVVPFLLYNLLPEERAAFAQAFPPIVTQQLVPIVWREKWTPMAPFLLA